MPARMPHPIQIGAPDEEARGAEAGFTTSSTTATRSLRSWTAELAEADQAEGYDRTPGYTRLARVPVKYRQPPEGFSVAAVDGALALVL
jgi:hypothetical protein